MAHVWAAHASPDSYENVVVQRWPADAYLAVFLMNLAPNPSACQSWNVRWSNVSAAHWNVPPRSPLQPYSILHLPPRWFPFFFLFFFFYLDRKTPEVFLMGKSWRGMLLREQGVRVESRSSGFNLTPHSWSNPKVFMTTGIVSEHAADVRKFLLSRIQRFWLRTAPFHYFSSFDFFF